MSAEEKTNDILTLFKRSSINPIGKEKKQQNTPKIIYDDTGFVTDDAILKSIMSQFVSNKKHIQAVKKIDEGNYTKEYFEENLSHYSTKLHKVLEKCSSKKTHDDNLVLQKQEGVFTLDFS